MSRKNSSVVTVFQHLRKQPRDLLAAISVPAVLTVVGSAGLTLIGVETFRSSARAWVPPAIWTWASENSILIVLSLVAMILLPQIYDSWATQALFATRESKKNVELSTAARSLSLRTAHLVTKTEDSIGGVRDNQYIRHTVIECCKYFRLRAAAVNGVPIEAQVEAVLFEVVVANDGSPVKLDRKYQTHETRDNFAPNFTRNRNPLCGKLLDTLLVERVGLYKSSEDDVAELEKAMGGTVGGYREYLIVPVMKDRKVEGVEGIYGALMLMSEEPHTFYSTDRELLATYAWYCTAAISVDRVNESFEVA